MKLLVEHLFVALTIGCSGWALSGNIDCIPSALIAGWLIDADHLCDFLLCSFSGKKINLAYIPSGEYFKINDKIIVPLHAWEISILLLLLGIFSPEYRAPFLSAAFAHIAHLAQDQWTYRVRLLGYLFLSRMNSGFGYKDFCRSGNG
jgi:hypothetical protein